MKVLSCQLTNFASYENLSFTFSNKGLTLVHGPNGSGKSTLCDATPWCLFGRTAKGGAVDEVLSWPGDKVVEGTIDIEINDVQIRVFRSRGPKAKDNDLWYWDCEELKEIRGKDIPDTQKLLNKCLGMDFNLYLAGSYYHEFSKIAQFFTTDAKNRRAICEQLVDLSLPIKLQNSISEDQRTIGLQLKKDEQEHGYLSLSLKNFIENESKLLRQEALWTSKRSDEVAELIDLCINFETNKKKTISKLYKKYEEFEENRKNTITSALCDIIPIDSCSIPSETCPTCGVPNQEYRKTLIKSDRAQVQYEAALAAINPYEKQIEDEKARSNSYTSLKNKKLKEKSPFEASIKDNKKEKLNTANAITTLMSTIDDNTTKYLDLELLSAVVADFRSQLINNTINELQNSTNDLLSRHFDAEIRVEFIAQEADKIEVTISKDGNICSYTQLSKGQRQLLRLCFSVSVMKSVANHHGLSFNCLFFDESFEGLSEAFKTKAFGLLDNLALDYESVFVVEHSETMKNMFENQVEIALINGCSEINEH